MVRGEVGEEVQLLNVLCEDVLRGPGREEGAGKAKTGGAQVKVGWKKDKGEGRYAQEERARSQRRVGLHVTRVVICDGWIHRSRIIILGGLACARRRYRAFTRSVVQ